jgi:predicted metal-binding membrane protein
MDMGGMDMTSFRMIPAGIGIMASAVAPWHWFEFATVFAIWAVMMIGMMIPFGDGGGVPRVRAAMSPADASGAENDPR